MPALRHHVQTRRLREQDKHHPIEEVGRELRGKMAFLNPVVVEAGEAQSAVDSTTNASPAGAGAAR